MSFLLWLLTQHQFLLSWFSFSWVITAICTFPTPTFLLTVPNIYQVKVCLSESRPTDHFQMDDIISELTVPALFSWHCFSPVFSAFMNKTTQPNSLKVSSFPPALSIPASMYSCAIDRLQNSSEVRALAQVTCPERGALGSSWSPSPPYKMTPKSWTVSLRTILWSGVPSCLLSPTLEALHFIPNLSSCVRNPQRLYHLPHWGAFVIHAPEHITFRPKLWAHLLPL